MFMQRSTIVDIMFCEDMSRKLTSGACFLYIFHISFQIQHFVIPSCPIAGTLSLVSCRPILRLGKCTSTLAITFSGELSLTKLRCSCDVLLVVSWGNDFHNLTDLQLMSYLSPFRQLGRDYLSYLLLQFQCPAMSGKWLDLKNYLSDCVTDKSKA